MRRRKLLGNRPLTAVTLVILAAYAVWPRPPVPGQTRKNSNRAPVPGLTWENFDRVQGGMTLQDVEAILGKQHGFEGGGLRMKRPGEVLPDPHSDWGIAYWGTWDADNFNTVSFNTSGRVSSKSSTTFHVGPIFAP
jgi:hypothetical protein